MTAASLWLRTAFPVMAIGSSDYDDALFVRAARSLALGQWLGPYDNRTLAKGMFHSLFMVWARVCAIPLKTAEQLLYLAVGAMVAGFVGRLAGRRWLGLALFALLAFSPIYWNPSLGRAVREGTYGSVALAVVALTVMLAFSRASLLRRLLLAAGLGLVAAAFWLTREEGPWIFPSLGLAIAAAGAGVLIGAGQGRDPPARTGRALIVFAAPLALAAVVAIGAVGLEAAVNAQHYGVLENTEFQDSTFPRAYGALTGIAQDHWRPYVMFPKDARQRAYAVSPAARELRPFLEGDIGNAWRLGGCRQVAAKDCPEVLAGWLMWELRDAAAAAGHTGSATEARAFYARLAKEVEAGCRARLISCLAMPRRTMAPPFRPQYIQESIGPALVLAKLAFTQGGGEVAGYTSAGDAASLAPFVDVVGDIAPAPVPSALTLQGWVAAAGEIPALSVVSGAGPVSARQTPAPAPDVEAAVPALMSRRFTLSAACPPGACKLLFATRDGASVALPWDQLRPGPGIDEPTRKLYLDAVTETDGAPSVSKIVRQKILGVASLIGKIYAAVVPLLSAVALIGLLAALARRAAPGALLALSAACLTAVLCRIALLAYMDATSMPAANLLYVSPAAPFVLVFVVTGVYAGWQALRGRGPSAISSL